MSKGSVTRRRVLSANAAAAIGGVLAACAGPGGGQDATAPAKKLTGTVDFWSNALYPYQGGLGEKLVAEFQQANPGLTIKWTDTPYADFMSKLVTTAAGGNPPDITYADRYVTKSYACAGVSRALDDLMKSAKYAKASSFWPRLQHDMSFKGKFWGVPHAPDVGLLYYNKNHFRESGLDPEKPLTTWDQAVDAIRRLTKRSAASLDRAGWPPLRGWGVPWMVMYWQLGGELTDAEEKKALYNNEQAIQVFDWIQRAYDLQGGNDGVDQAYQGANNYDAFAQGKTAMVWAPHTLMRQRWEKEPNLEVGATFWPTPPNNRHANYMGGWSIVVAKGAKNPEGAFHYLDFLTSDDAQIRWAEDWNNVPATKSASEAPRYLGSRPERRVAVGEMPTAKWVITAPGGDKALPHQTAVANNVITRKLSVRDALAESVRLVQEQLDEAARTCGA